MNAMIQAPAVDFAGVIDVVAQSVRSPATARAYTADLDDWRLWCAVQQCDALCPTYRTVRAYIDHLAAAGASRATITRRVSAIRKLAHVLAVLDPTDADRRAARDSLEPSLLQVQAGHADERDKRALSPAQVGRVLAAWDDSSLMSARNKAIVAVMFCSGLRRAEVAALRWADVDTHEGMIHVLHGKGDKARTVPIYGEVANRALVAWWASLPVGRVYVFPRLWRGDALGPDEPITVDGLYYVVRETVERSGVEFRPHDARRTFITERLHEGAPLADVQADAGHARAETTLGYAQPAEAKERRKRGRLRYG